jgi:hypothetical protein
MESEKNLNTPDFSSTANISNATAAMNASAQDGPK